VCPRRRVRRLSRHSRLLVPLLSWSRFFYRASSFPSSLRNEHGIHVTAFYVLVYSGQNGVQKPYHIQHNILRMPTAT
jgi:hypothetical protein